MTRATGCMETSILAKHGRPILATSVAGLRETSISNTKQALCGELAGRSI